MKSRITLSMLALALIALMGSTSVSAQNTYDRISVVEQFTSATCGPCVAAGPVMARVISLANGSVSIRYHMNFPAPGDPWNVQNPADNASRQQFYSVNGIPTARVNGKATVDPRNEAQLTQTIGTDNAVKAPAKITVTQAGTAVKVKIETNVDLKSHKLHVALVSRKTVLEDLPANLPGSNQETEFGDAMLKMMPNAGGTVLSLDANSSKEFDFTFNQGQGDLWPAGQQYVIAFIQANTSREVIQAGSNLDEVFARLEFKGTKWQKIDKGAKKTASITVSNPGKSAMEAELSIANGQALVDAGWQIALSEEVIALAAGASKNITVETTAPANAGFAAIALNAKPINITGIPRESSIEHGYLTNGARAAVWAGITSGAAGQYVSAMATTHAGDVVFIPATQEVVTAFPPTEFDAGIFPVGVDGRFNIPAVAQLAVNMTSQGKGVYVAAPMGISVSTADANQQFAGYPEANAWVSETLGLKLQGTGPVARYTGNTLTPFTLNGIAAEPLGQNDKTQAAVWNLNRPTQSWPFYCEVQDVFSINAGSKSVAWSYSDNKTTNIVGVRCENSGQGRVVYSSWGVEHANDANARKILMQRILDYLMPAGDRPVISLNNTTLNFGTVSAGTTKDMTLTITNTGKANLEISTMTITGSGSSLYKVTAGGVSGSNVVLAPNASRSVTVQYAPTGAGTAAANLVISNNDAPVTVSLRGTSTTTSVETDVVSETGAIGMTLVGANPVSSSSAIRVRANGDLRVSVVNAAGQEVATLFSGMVNGTELVNVDASMLTSGAYNVVASNGADRATLSVVVAR
ncbi:MAG: choice-of-anchor D domain-containing protein [Candidatus Kapabacteria bacterium]|nr:choice-of-anchor D domain-containing protein [Candidatus Kapabacteria bacterium]